jgi:hypothetical protein
LDNFICQFGPFEHIDGARFFASELLVQMLDITNKPILLAAFKEVIQENQASAAYHFKEEKK